MRASLFLVSFALVACSADQPSAEDVEFSDGKADGTSTVVRVELDHSYEIEVDSGTYGALWLELKAGEHAGLVARGHEGFAPYLVVKSRSNVIVSRGDQATLSRLDSTDVVATLSGPLQAAIVVAGGPSLETAGIATLNVVRLDEAPTIDFDLRGPAQRAVYDALRRWESNRHKFTELGALSELESGFLATDPRGVPLAERSQLIQTAVEINALREQHSEQVDPEEPTRASRIRAQLIAALAVDE